MGQDIIFIKAEKMLKEEKGLDVIYDWISQKLTEARMEQDCINQKYILDMQDEIARLAKIDENRHHSKVFPTETSQIIFTKQVFLDRITELEKKKT